MGDQVVFFVVILVAFATILITCLQQGNKDIIYIERCIRLRIHLSVGIPSISALKMAGTMLSRRQDFELASAVVESVTVFVVDFIARGWVHNEDVHFEPDTTSVFVDACSCVKTT